MAKVNPDTGVKMGRPIGAMNRLAHEARTMARETGKLPHEILLDMARGVPVMVSYLDGATVKQRAEVLDIEQMKDAAKAAAPYYAPKISTVEVISGVSEDELDAIIAGAAAEAEISFGTDGESETREATQTPRERVLRRVNT